MSRSRTLLTSPLVLSHPVSQALGLSAADRDSKPSSKQIEESGLVVVDCRQTSPAELAAGGGLVQDALAGGKPLLFLEPGTPHTEALCDAVSGCPQEPQSALLVQGRTNPSGLRDFDVAGLGHPLEAGPGAETAADSRLPRNGDAETSHCRCTPSGQGRSPLALSPESLDGFVARVRRQVDAKASPAQDSTIPTGLKYFQQNIAQSYSFTYQSASYTQPGAGALDLSWSVWGFLSQSQSANSQVLIVQAAYSLSPGTLIANNDEDRGFVNCYLNASAKPSFAAYQYQPTSACDSWSGTVSVPISYLSPTGGYQVYTFESSVNNSVTDWCVQNISSGSSQGSQWYMNSPCNGADVGDDWQDAFDWTGKVESMPSASTGTLSVNAVSAWNTSTLQTGYVSVPASLQWEGAHFYSSSCGLIGCYKINCGFSSKSWNPSWSFNFGPLNPS
jgi:hypothetical protein